MLSLKCKGTLKSRVEASCTICVLLLFLFCFSWVLPTITPAAENNAKEKVTLHLRWHHQFQFAGYYAAVEKGFYADEGLDVALQEIKRGTGMIAPVLDGTADYGVADGSLLAARSQGKPVVLLAQIYQHSPQVFLSLRETGVVTPHDLSGKTAMFDTEDASLNILLIETLGSNWDFDVVPQSYNLNDLIDGTVDIVSAYLSNEPYKLQKMGLQFNILHPRGYGVDYFGDNLFTSEAEIRNNPQRVRKMIRATLKGWNYALNNKNEIIDLIISTYSPDADRAKLEYEARIIEQMILPDFVPLGHVDRSRYEEVARGYARLGMIESPQIPPGFIYQNPELNQLNTVSLTEQEQAWLDAHPHISLTFSANYEPAVIRHSDGSYSGTLVDFLSLLNQRLGTRIKLDIDTVQEAVQKVKDGRAEGYLALHPLHSDKLGFLKTSNYVKAYPTIFGSRELVLNVPSDLTGKKIVHIKSEFYSKNIINQSIPNATIITVDSSLDGLQMVARGEADAYVGLSSNSYFLSKYQISGLVPKYIFYDVPQEFGMAIRNDLPELVSILDKGIASISKEEMHVIGSKWIQFPEQLERIALTTEERTWLHEHPNITFGFSNVFEPYLIQSSDGRHTGIMIDILSKINNLLGSTFDVHVDDVPKIFEKVKSKELDGVLALTSTIAGTFNLLDTVPLFPISYSFFKLENATFTFSGLDDLQSKTVAILESALNVETLLTPYKDDITIVKFPTNLEAIQAVFEGKADLALALTSLNYTILKHGFTGITPVHTLQKPSEVIMAVRNDHPELVNILNKAIAGFKPYELEAIKAKWIRSTVQSSTDLDLSPSEKKWLSQKHRVQVRSLDIPPFVIDDGNDEPTGIGIDYLRLVAQRTGIQFEYHNSGKTFIEAVDGLKNHQGPDLMPVIIPTPERQESVLFTEDYITSPIMIFTRSDEKQIITEIDDLAGKTVATLAGSVHHKILETTYPAIKIAPFGVEVEALEALSSGEADAYIGNLLLASYHILHRGLYNLKLAAPTPLGDHVISMGIRNDWPELASIVNKGFSSITEEEHTAIRNRYISLKYEASDAAEYIKWLLIVGVISSTLIALFLIWNRALTRQVVTHTSALRESERKYRGVLETTSTVPWERDVVTGTYTFMGKQIEQILGYPSDSWREVDEWVERLHPEDREQAVQFYKTELLEGRDHDFTFRMLHKDGSYRWVRDVVSIAHGSDGPQKLVGFMHDVTEQHELAMEKEQLKTHWEQAQKLEAVGTLAGGIAHDFNNILSAIIGFTELAKDREAGDPDLPDDLDEILRAGHRAKDLVQQILAFSRQSQIERILIKPQLIIKETLKMLRPTLPSTIDIKEHISADCGMVSAVPTQVHQILVNLTTNAFHSMEETGGTMTVELRKAEHIPPELVNTTTGYVQLSVGDTGQGIDLEIIDRIFDPFFTTKEPGKGTGMGLSIIYGIVKDHGGIITVDSVPGKHTIFHVFLPLHEDSPQITASQEGDIIGGREKILFIDDEPALTRAGQSMLEKLGYEVTAETECMKALKLFEAQPDSFDLIITDQTMPGMTGFELAKKVLQIRPETPIILCTGYSSIINEEVAKSQGIRAFATKPVSKQTISILIREVLDNPSAPV